MKGRHLASRTRPNRDCTAAGHHRDRSGVCLVFNSRLPGLHLRRRDVDMVRIIAGILALVMVVIIILRRRRGGGEKKDDEDDV